MLVTMEYEKGVPYGCWIVKVSDCENPVRKVFQGKFALARKEASEFVSLLGFEWLYLVNESARTLSSERPKNSGPFVRLFSLSTQYETRRGSSTEIDLKNGSVERRGTSRKEDEENSCKKRAKDSRKQEKEQDRRKLERVLASIPKNTDVIWDPEVGALAIVDLLAGTKTVPMPIGNSVNTRVNTW